MHLGEVRHRLHTTYPAHSYKIKYRRKLRKLSVFGTHWRRAAGDTVEFVTLLVHEDFAGDTLEALASKAPYAVGTVGTYCPLPENIRRMNWINHTESKQWNPKVYTYCKALWEAWILTSQLRAKFNWFSLRNHKMATIQSKPSTIQSSIQSNVCQHHMKKAGFEQKIVSSPVSPF